MKADTKMAKNLYTLTIPSNSEQIFPSLISHLPYSAHIP
jgi:hypothetical protein